MYTEVLQSIVGIELFPVVSLVLFVAVFTVMLVRVARTNPSELERCAAIPLDGPTATQTAGPEDIRRPR